MKEIIYTNGIKHPKGAQYRKVDKLDRKWVLEALHDYNDMVKEARMLIETNQLSAEATKNLQEWLDKNIDTPHAKLPRQGEHGDRFGKRNTVGSFIEGVIHNFGSRGTQNDLSEKVCDGIEVVFDVLDSALNIEDSIGRVKFVKRSEVKPTINPLFKFDNKGGSYDSFPCI